MLKKTVGTTLFKRGCGIALILMSCLCLETAHAQSIGEVPSLDIVIDLDGTLIFNQPKPIAGSFKADGDFYRFGAFSAEFVDALRKIPGARLSFFSGADRERNDVVLDRLILADGKKASQIMYRQLNNEDLTQVSKNEKLRFSYRYKKDLTKVNPDLSRIILVDDVKNFILPGQEKNMLWLGTGAEGNEALKAALETIKEAEVNSRKIPADFLKNVDAIMKRRSCERVFLAPAI